MANIAPANFAYVNANGDKGDVQVLSAADITLLNEGLQDIEDLKLAVQKPLPAGTVIPFAGNVIPEGFLICNGAAVSRTTYASLFAAIGTLYGTGDGSTTFALPDYRGRVLQGADDSHAAGSYIPAGLPNITGAVDCVMAGPNWSAVAGCSATRIGTNSLTYGNSTSPGLWLNFTASNSNALYGASSTVQPAAGSIQYLIKY